MPTLFVARRLPIDPSNLVEQDVLCEVYPHDRAPSRAELLSLSEGADGMITLLSDAIDADFFSMRSNLKVVCNYAVGYDNIDIEAANKHGVWVTNTPGVLTEATADIAWALVLSLCRKVIAGHQMVASGAFSGWSPTMLLGKELNGTTLGIFGFGRIGQAVARRARGFGMKVVYTSRSPVPINVRQKLDAEPVTKNELLATSDIISVHAPLNKSSLHAFGETEFEAMKDDALLINTSRGAVVDEVALVHALGQGQIGGAGLDVYEEEPRVHPGLLKADNVVLLPHLGSATYTTRETMVRIVVDNAMAALRGKTPKNAVNNPRAALSQHI